MEVCGSDSWGRIKLQHLNCVLFRDSGSLSGLLQVTAGLRRYYKLYIYIIIYTYLYTCVLYDCGCHIFFQILTRNLPQALPPAGDDEFQCLGKFNPNSQVRGPQGPRVVMFKLCLNRVPYIIYIYIYNIYIYIHHIYIHHIYIYHI